VLVLGAPPEGRRPAPRRCWPRQAVFFGLAAGPAGGFRTPAWL